MGARRNAPGGSTTQFVTFQIDNAAPTVTLDEPAGSTVSGVQTLAATATDLSGIRSVDFFIAPETLTFTSSPLPNAPTSGPLRAIADMDGDRRSDFLWQPGSTPASVIITSTDPDIPAATIDAASCTAPPGSTLVGAGDFDRDARADLVFLEPASADPNSGTVTIWRMDRLHCMTSIAVNRHGSQGWQIVAVGDLSGDGAVDILWRNPTLGPTATVVWVMRSETHVTSVPISRPVPAPWIIVGIGDIDGDSKADVLLHEPDLGANVAWLMNGLAWRASLILPQQPTPDLSLVGAAEINGDSSHPELIWKRDASTTMQFWEVSLPQMIRDFYPPYRTQWQSASVPNGSWRLTARATDVANNIAEASRVITVSN